MGLPMHWLSKHRIILFMFFLCFELSLNVINLSLPNRTINFVPVFSVLLKFRFLKEKIIEKNSMSVAPMSL